MPDPLIHLVCGSTGAGKTTYTRRLAGALGGVLFSIDQWMTALFWMDSPQPLDPGWSIERVGRCMDQIWAVARQVAARGTPCVLDLGFTRLKERSLFCSPNARAMRAWRCGCTSSTFQWRNAGAAWCRPMRKRAKPTSFSSR